MAKQTKWLAAKNSAAKSLTQKVGLGGSPRPPRKPKGRMFPDTSLLSKKFEDSIEAAAIKEQEALKELNITDGKKLKGILVDAHKLLDKEKVTVDDWLGRTFEVIGPTLPEVKLVEQEALKEILDITRRYILSGNSGFTFMNGQFEMAGVKKPFETKTIEIVHNTKIKGPRQDTGSDYVDRAFLISNSDGQKLLISIEFKTRGAAGGLKPQLAKRDDRIFGGEGYDVNSAGDLDKLYEAREGTKMTYNIEGKSGTHETDLENIILLRNTQNPALLRESDVFTKIGIRAGKKFRLTIATDAGGGKYIRVIVPVNTDALRSVIKRLLRDRSWQ